MSIPASESALKDYLLNHHDQYRELASEHRKYETRLRELEDIVARWGIDYDPLIEPMRVFCGLDESQIVAARVLEYSIRKRASAPVRLAARAIARPGAARAGADWSTAPAGGGRAASADRGSADRCASAEPA